MIDLTPLDVRKKRGDFRNAFRGYDPEEVDAFLEMVADRLEDLVKRNLTLEERVERLQEQVQSQENREEAVREALVTAQELRKDVREQARREADLLRREAESRVEGMLAEAERRLEERREALEELERMRVRFLKSFRTLLERQMDAVEVEEGRSPLEEVPLEIDFTVGDLEEDLPEPDAEAADEASPEIRKQGSRASEPPEAAVDADEDVGAEPDGDAGAADAEAERGSDAGAEEDAASPAAEPGGAAASPTPGESAPSDDEPGADPEEAGEDDESLWLSAILKDEDEGEGPKEEDSWS